MLSRAVLLATGLAALVSVAVEGRSRGADAAPNTPTAASGASDERLVGDPAAPCPPETLPDGPVCVHLPAFPFALADVEPLEASHLDRRGRLQTYEQIPRRPERPADYQAYRYPVAPGLPDGRFVISGYDLDLPDALQRRGRRLRAIGHGGVDLPQARGAPIRLVALEAQQGDADVVYVGALFGTTVVTRHTVREGGKLRDYLLLFGHLEGPAPGLTVGGHLADGSLVGFVGDTGSPELVHLHLEARRVRDELDITKVPPARLLDSDVSVVCDPRNVLPRAR